jgi:hypothetical protein
MVQEHEQEVFLTLDNYRVEAKIPVNVYSYFSDNTDINVNKEILDAIIADGRKQLCNQFFNFIEDNISETHYFPLYPKDNIIKRVFRFIYKNSRYSLKNKEKGKIERDEYFTSIIESLLEDYFERGSFDEHPFVIVSPKLANFIAINMKDFEKGKQSNDIILHPFGVFGSDSNRLRRTTSVFVNPLFNENILYFGTTKSSGYGPIMFYNVSEDALMEFSSPMSDLENSEIVYRLSLFHKLHSVGKVKYKKIIFEDDSN